MFVHTNKYNKTCLVTALRRYTPVHNFIKRLMCIIQFKSLFCLLMNLLCLSFALSTDLNFLSCINVITIVECWLNFVFYYSTKKKSVNSSCIFFFYQRREKKESLLSDVPICAALRKLHQNLLVTMYFSCNEL